MQGIEMRRFESLAEFASTTADLFRGPTFLGTFLSLEPKFREKLILAVSITNNCGLCCNAHTLAGLLAGLTAKDIEDLVALEQERYSEKEWLALRWARGWASARGQEPAGKTARDFAARYAPRERAHILKIARMMKFANYFNNTLFGLPWRAGLSESGENPAGWLGKLKGPLEGLFSGAARLALERA